ncbi:bud site selection protein 20 [Geosmithia morbida]|uniref:Bud site selection protein 20 n=1 Tax=Geosmithia morbida TaxID=1094350 RepID=A0A9P4YSA5_9HYPO|nr:bud site selection protein 20 [Geosmithia morbida]KAF4121602.1 bud site selection protein 20 [Geosmithia morbida]
MGVPNKRTITKTRRKTRDLDQIKDDLLSPRHLTLFKETKSIEDLPDLGRNYCVECAKWFDTEQALVAHRGAKPHKRRLKQLKEGAYTLKEANAAGGLWSDNGKTTSNEAGPQVDVDMMT